MNSDMPSDDDESFAEIEEMLMAMEPVALSDDLLTRLANAMDEAAVARPVNVITMDEIRRGTQVLQAAETKTASRPRRNLRWAWAAAVAFMGACTAFFVTHNPNNAEQIIASEANYSEATDNDAYMDTTIAPYGSSFSNSSVAVAYDGLHPAEESPLKEKTLWYNSDSPHKYIQVNYTKIYQGQDKDGRPIEISVPATRYILVPDEAY